MKKLFRTIDKILDKHIILLFSLLVLALLRAPNFSDPYWYGDEAIYLTVGQSIRSGKNLYTEIVDHKTPLIYYFATVPNQFWFRVLITAWMIVSTVAFYKLLRHLFKSKVAISIGSILFVLLTTLPTFEGHIPNGELFVLGFILLGFSVLIKSNYLQTVLDDSASLSKLKKSYSFKALFFSGVFFGLGFLTKVPALLDFGAFLYMTWLFFFQKVFKIQTNNLAPNKNYSFQQIEIFSSLYLRIKSAFQITCARIFNRDNFKGFISLICFWLPSIVGFLSPVLISIIYFVLVGSGQDYLEFGLLYNLHYSQSWTHDFGSSFINFLFSLSGKTLVLAALLLALSLIKKVSIKTKFFAGWYLLTLYSALLSNRPYPHYYQQIFPPLILLVSNFIDQLNNQKIIPLNSPKRLWSQASNSFIAILICVILTKSIFNVIGFGTYSTQKYYTNFLKFITGQISQEKYYQSFNYLTTENYQLADFLISQSQKNLFIWGNNAMLYALSNTVPTSRYTVAFHIEDMNAYEETISQLRKEKPRYIVLMNNAPTNFPEFFEFLATEYSPNHSYNHMTLFKRTTNLYPSHD